MCFLVFKPRFHKPHIYGGWWRHSELPNRREETAIQGKFSHSFLWSIYVKIPFLDRRFRISLAKISKNLATLFNFHCLPSKPNWWPSQNVIQAIALCLVFHAPYLGTGTHELFAKVFCSIFCCKITNRAFFIRIKRSFGFDPKGVDCELVKIRLVHVNYISSI